MNGPHERMKLRLVNDRASAQRRASALFPATGRCPLGLADLQQRGEAVDWIVRHPDLRYEPPVDAGVEGAPHHVGQGAMHSIRSRGRPSRLTESSTARTVSSNSRFLWTFEQTKTGEAPGFSASNARIAA